MNFFDKIIDFLDPLSGLVKACGIAGAALGIFLLIVKLLIKKLSFSSLNKQQTFKIIRLLIITCFSIALAGVICYGALQYKNQRQPEQSRLDSMHYEPLKLEKTGISVSDSTNKHK